MKTFNKYIIAIYLTIPIIFLLNCGSDSKKEIESFSTTNNSNIIIVSDFSNRLNKIKIQDDITLIDKVHKHFIEEAKKPPYPYFSSFKYDFLNIESAIYFSGANNPILKFPFNSTKLDENNLHNEYFRSLNLYIRQFKNKFRGEVENIYNKKTPAGGADVYNFFNKKLNPEKNFPKTKILQQGRSEKRIHNFRNTVILFTDGFLESGELIYFQWTRSKVKEIQTAYSKLAKLQYDKTKNKPNEIKILEEIYPNFKIDNCPDLKSSFKNYKKANPNSFSQAIICNVKGTKPKPLNGLELEIDEETIIAFFWEKWLLDCGFDKVTVLSHTELQTKEGLTTFENLIQ